MQGRRVFNSPQNPSVLVFPPRETFVSRPLPVPAFSKKVNCSNAGTRSQVISLTGNSRYPVSRRSPCTLYKLTHRSDFLVLTKAKQLAFSFSHFVVRMQGLEPQLLVPETSVLPLDDIRFTFFIIPYM